MTLTRDGHIQILKINVSIFPDVGERYMYSEAYPGFNLDFGASLFTVPLVTMVYVISLITALLYLLPDFIWMPDTLFSNITTNLIFYGL